MAKVTQLKIELEQEEDGRWIGEVQTLPGVMAYGQTKAAALAAVMSWLFVQWPIASNMARRCLRSF